MPEPMRPHPMTPTFVMVMRGPVSSEVLREMVRRGAAYFRARPGRGSGSKWVPGGQGFLTVIVTAPYRTLPSGWISPSGRRAGGPGSFMARSNAASRDSEMGAAMLSSIDALIGDFASSATAVADQVATRTRTPANAAILFIGDQRMERGLLQFVPTVKKRELDHERHPHDLPAELADQPQSCPHRTTG